MESGSGDGWKDSFSSAGTVDVREELAGVWATKTTTTRTDFRTFEHSDIISLDISTAHTTPKRSGEPTAREPQPRYTVSAVSLFGYTRCTPSSSYKFTTQLRTTSVEECDRILRDLNRDLDPADVPRSFNPEDGEWMYTACSSPPHRPPEEDERDELLVAELQQQLEVITS